jgi:hypothetical protein
VNQTARNPGLTQEGYYCAEGRCKACRVTDQRRFEDLDEDCDGLIDRADPDCRGEICRPATDACDVEARCMARASCPADSGCVQAAASGWCRENPAPRGDDLRGVWGDAADGV